MTMPQSRDSGSGLFRCFEGICDLAAKGLTFWSLFLFGLFLLFVAMWIPAEKQFHEIFAREKCLRREIRKLKAANVEAKACLEAVRTDRYYLEKVLREQQGLSAQGELVVRNRLDVIPGE